MKKYIALMFVLAILVSITGCTANSPKDSVQSFIDNWQKQDFGAMYQQISLDSQKAISEEDFVKRYQNIYNGIEVGNLVVTPQYPAKLKPDGEGKIHVPFDLSMDTLGGQIKFSHEVVMVKEKGAKGKGWYVVWDSKMIFPQMEDGDKIRAKTIKAVRGEIKDRQGRGIAVNGKVAAIGVVPGKIEEVKDAVKTQLAQILNISAEQIDQKLNQSWVKPDYFVPIARVSLEDKAKIDKLLAITGVMEKEENARVYPYKAVTAHLTGYVGAINAEELAKLKDKGYDENSYLGKAGLEQIFEQRLKGQDGGTVYIEDSKGNKKTVLAEREVKNGENVTLTIDVSLQQKLFAQLNGEKGAAVAIQPKTGETLALVSSPSYDPNLFVMGITDAKWKELNDETTKPMLSRFQQIYAPGSTFKPITAAIGLKSGKLDPNQKVSISGLKWQKDSSWGSYYVTRMADTHGPIDLAGALVVSDNIYFAQAALKIGKETLANEAKQFGFGEDISFELPLRKSQLSGEEGIKGETQLADSGYGQGQILVNPLHLALIYSSLVNDGKIMQPYLEAGKGPKVWKENAMTVQAASIIFRDLVQVIEKGTAKNPPARTPMAGKTGTAELNKTSVEETGQENGWFVAVNSNNPRLLIAMLIEDVKDKGGSHYVVPKVKKVMDESLK